MKIAILQDRLRLGGTESQALALGWRWADAGHDVRLMVFRPGGALAESPLAERLAPKVLQPFDIGLDNWAPGLGKAVAKFAPDVVVAFGREANAKLPRLQKIFPRPALVGTLRSGRPQPARFWRALQGADLVVTNSQWARDAAEQKGISKNLLRVIYNGLARDVHASDPVAARKEWRARLQTPEGAVVFLCVAGFRPGKGQEVLLAAMAKMPDGPSWQLCFLGDGPTLEPCRQLAAKLNIGDRVKFLGQGAPEPLYMTADVAVLASHGEALPNFLIEAQAAGLPVVAAIAGGVSECFAHPHTGTAVPAGDLPALTAALDRARRDNYWRENTRQPAQTRARELFDPARNAARWLELFASLR